MDPQVKEKWVAALRSGEYAQCTGALQNPFGFCCIGVLLDVAGGGEWVPAGRVLEDGAMYYSVDIEGTSLLLDTDSGKLAPSFGLSKEIGDTEVPSNMIAPSGAAIEELLIEMNDTAKMSFSEIADWVEKTL